VWISAGIKRRVLEDKAVGGTRGTVEGKTRVATWLALKAELKRMCDDALDNVGRKTYVGGLYLQFPKSKKEAYRMMERKTDASGWILRYRIHS